VGLWLLKHGFRKGVFCFGDRFSHWKQSVVRCKKRADNYMALSVVVSFLAINSILGGRWTLAMELNF
jgi:hypothetical protein